MVVGREVEWGVGGAANPHSLHHSAGQAFKQATKQVEEVETSCFCFFDSTHTSFVPDSGNTRCVRCEARRGPAMHRACLLVRGGFPSEREGEMVRWREMERGREGERERARTH